MTSVIVMADSNNHRSACLNCALLYFLFKRNVMSADIIEVVLSIIYK